MKKIYLLFLLLLSLGVQAQELTVSLQQGDKMIPFYGEDALVNAYEAAADSGAVITLSPGVFKTMSNIFKSVTLVGTYGFSDQADRTVLSSVAVNASHVRFEGLQFTGTVSLGAITDFHIKRCYVSSLTSTDKHVRTIVDQCRVLSETAVQNGENYCIKNSVVNFASSNTSANMAFFTNSSLYIGSYCPYAVYRNCVLRTSDTSLTLSSPREFYYNVFTSSGYPGSNVSISNGTGCQYRGNTSLTYNSIGAGGDPFRPTNMPKGEDGTLIGPMGGTGFSPYPSIPRIVKQNIGKSTDGEGNLSVELDVQAEP